MKKIVVLVSGKGTTLQAIMDACRRREINGKVVAVFSDNADALALQRARQAGVPACTVPIAHYPHREAYDLQLIKEINFFQPDLLLLAGFMRILSPAFVAHFQQRMLNIHPSLLPHYPGLNTHRKALANGDKEHGTSVHFVTDTLDGGPVILQAKVPIFDGDTLAELKARVQHQEHRVFPLAAGWFLDGRLLMRDNAVWLDGEKLPPFGLSL